MHSTETKENRFLSLKAKKETLMEGDRSGFLIVIIIKKKFSFTLDVKGCFFLNPFSPKKIFFLNIVKLVSYNH